LDKIKIKKLVLAKLAKEATGEMSQHDLEQGGEWHEARKELEELCRRSGLKCKVKPFDQYQGPYALIDDSDHDHEYPAKVWLNQAEHGDKYLLVCKDLDTSNKGIPFSTPQELKNLMKPDIAKELE